MNEISVVFDTTDGKRLPTAIYAMMIDVSPDTKLFAEKLSELFEANVNRVHGFVLARSGSRSLAEDVTGDVFVEAARRFQEGRGSEVTPSWLMVVARRRLIDRWRRAESQRTRVRHLRRERPPPDLETSDRDERVFQSLRSLPTRQLTALSLRYLEGYSVAEVADLMSVSYRTAESLLARARVSFRRSYEGAR